MKELVLATIEPLPVVKQALLVRATMFNYIMVIAVQLIINLAFILLKC